MFRNVAHSPRRGDHLCAAASVCNDAEPYSRQENLRGYTGRSSKGDPFDKSRYLGGEGGVIRPVTFHPGNVLTRPGIPSGGRQIGSCSYDK